MEEKRMPPVSSGVKVCLICFNNVQNRKDLSRNSINAVEKHAEEITFEGGVEEMEVKDYSVNSPNPPTPPSSCVIEEGKDCISEFLEQIMQLDKRRRRNSKNRACDFKVLRSLPVCVGCGDVIKLTVVKKSDVDRLEEQVRDLQMQVVKMMGRLKAELNEYYWEMKRLEEIVKTSGQDELEAALKINRMRSGVRGLEGLKSHHLKDGYGDEIDEEDANDFRRAKAKKLLRESILQVVRELDADRTLRSGHLKRETVDGPCKSSTDDVMTRVECIEKVETEGDSDDDQEIMSTKSKRVSMSYSNVDLEDHDPLEEDGVVKTSVGRDDVSVRELEEEGSDADELADSSGSEFVMEDEEDNMESESESAMSSENDHFVEEERLITKRITTRKKYGQSKQDNIMDDPLSLERQPGNCKDNTDYVKILDIVNSLEMSDLKRKLVNRVLTKKYSPPSRKIDTPDRLVIPDPRLGHIIEYDHTSDSFFLDEVAFKVLEWKNHDSVDMLNLECSLCSWQPKPISRETRDRSRTTIESYMYNHIASKHLHLFQCAICGSNMGGYMHYKKHVLGHRSKSAFMCDICGRPLSSAGSLASHKWYHLNEQEAAELVAQGHKDPRVKKARTKSFPCPTCNKVFPARCYLKKHEMIHAPNRDRVTCEICGKLFFPYGLRSHRRRRCSTPGVETLRLSCLHCPKVFINKYVLKEHLEHVHQTERNVTCEQCGKRFKTKSALRSHLRTHVTDKAFSCTIGCGKDFKLRTSWKAHEKRCDGRGGVQIQKTLDMKMDNHFECEKGCGRSYKTAKYRRIHYKTCKGVPINGGGDSGNGLNS